MEPISWGAIATSVLGSVAGSAVSGMFGGKGGGQQEQAPQQPAAPPESQAAKTPTAGTFERQNATAEGPAMGSPGSTLLTGADLGAGTLGKAKTLGGVA